MSTYFDILPRHHKCLVITTSSAGSRSMRALGDPIHHNAPRHTRCQAPIVVKRPAERSASLVSDHKIAVEVQRSLDSGDADLMGLECGCCRVETDSSGVACLQQFGSADYCFGLREDPEDVSCDIALQPAHDFTFRFPLWGSTRNVFFGWRITPASH